MKASTHKQRNTLMMRVLEANGYKRAAASFGPADVTEQDRDLHRDSGTASR
jgi:hypothetical protein